MKALDKKQRFRSQFPQQTLKLREQKNICRTLSERFPHNFFYSSFFAELKFILNFHALKTSSLKLSTTAFSRVIIFSCFPKNRFLFLSNRFFVVLCAMVCGTKFIDFSHLCFSYVRNKNQVDHKYKFYWNTFFMTLFF